ncbi:winged helix-turn-helix domain-containing protein [Agromyces marinus]|uniref:winged helix-turn-helix domain-containing protein n=1 Tax=Agromyces marinus TaxID=1389020 RepID=UPI0025742E9D|nr:winged helix-turn-helix domain-containing protein [Agromyces marinus]
MTQPGATAAHHPAEPVAGPPGRPDHAAAIIDHLIDHGHATRTELAGATGLGRTTVAATVSRMLEVGVLGERHPADSRHGALRLAAADRVLLTAGVAGDDATATLADLDGTELARYEEPVAIVDDDRRPASAAPLDALALVVDRAIEQAERDGRPSPTPPSSSRAPLSAHPNSHSATPRSASNRSTCSPRSARDPSRSPGSKPTSSPPPDCAAPRRPAPRPTPPGTPTPCCCTSPATPRSPRRS